LTSHETDGAAERHGGLGCGLVGAAADAHRVCPARDESARPRGPAGADQPRCLLLSLYATRTGVPSAMRTRSLLAAVALACASSCARSRPVASQQAPSRDVPAAEVHKQLGPADIIMPHITDSKHVELPCWKGL